MATILTWTHLIQVLRSINLKHSTAVNILHISIVSHKLLHLQC